MELARRPRLQCENLRHFSQTHHSPVIQDHPLCYHRLHCGLVRSGHYHRCRHFLVKLVLPSSRSGPLYRLSVPSGTQNAIAPVLAPATQVDRAAAEC